MEVAGSINASEHEQAAIWQQRGAVSGTRRCLAIACSLRCQDAIAYRLQSKALSSFECSRFGLCQTQPPSNSL